MSAAEPDFIKSLKNGASQQDGLAVAFDIVTKDGKDHSYACTTDDLEKLISWLIGLGLLADQNREGSGKVDDGTAKKTIRAVPIRIKQLAAGAGDAPGEMLIAFDLGSMDLAFTLPVTAVDQLRRALEKSAAA
ncbi:MAG: hypothetical protein ACTSUD_01825 [Alphaproteobacteria bacterium]